MNGGSFPYHKRQDEMLSNALCISHLYNEADDYDVQQHFFSCWLLLGEVI